MTVATLDRQARDLWRLPPRLHLSDWADQHYWLRSGAANAGRWHTLPYQREILNAISNPAIERVVWMKSTRVGYTQCYLIALAYFIAVRQRDVLIVQPTIEDARQHSQEDIAPMLAEVPILQGRVPDARAKDSQNTLLSKHFLGGGSLLIVGANSPRGFRRTSRHVAIFDEVDGYPASAGPEGPPIALGIRRTDDHADRKLILGSTPVFEGGAIHTEFLRGDQRRYYVPCPTCGAFQVLKPAALKWPEGDHAAAHFVCEAQGCRIEHRDKRQMVEAGEWRAGAPEHFTELNRTASFHLWAAYSYSPNATWAQIAAEWTQSARDSLLAHRTFKMTVLGEPWQVEREATDWEALFRRREPYPLGSVPAGVRFLTVGVDVQKDRLVYEIVGWGRGKTSWSIDAGAWAGDPANADSPCWAEVDALLGRTFLHPYGVPLPIRRLAVDANFYTTTVTKWAERYSSDRVIPVQGRPGHGRLILDSPRAVHVTETGRSVKRGARLWPVYGKVAKDELYAFLKFPAPLEGEPEPPGFCHFPEYGREFFRQLTAEHLVEFKGRSEYAVIPGRENHALDARVYARAAASLLDRATEADWAELDRRVAAPPPVAGPGPALPLPPSPPRPPRPWLGDRPRGGGWLR